MNNTNQKLVDKDAKKLGAKILVLKLKKITNLQNHAC